MSNGFTVIDTKTGKYPNCCKIALKEKWAKNLVYCDIDQFAMLEDGTLILTDDCGNVAYPPCDRFKIIFDDEYTPEAFAKRMKRIADNGVEDARYFAGEELMMEFLRHLGYGEGCDIFEEFPRWYD